MGDLYFLDGSCPPSDIIAKFLHIAENEPGAIAVHCKAVLGRTGTLIGLYCMKHYQFPARAFIGWNRICRPGSILGPQQQFMCDMQAEMWQAGATIRGPGRSLNGDLNAQMERLTVSNRERAAHEMVEDVGQGERLCGARRGAAGGMFGGGDAGGGASASNSRGDYRGGSRRDSRGDPDDAPSADQSKQKLGIARRGLRGMFRR